MKFDKNKPYGQVSGAHGGAVFEQGGALFDADCQEIIFDQEDETEHGKPSSPAAPVKATVAKQKPAKEPKSPKVKAEEQSADAHEQPVVDPVDAQLAAQGA